MFLEKEIFEKQKQIHQIIKLRHKKKEKRKKKKN